MSVSLVTTIRSLVPSKGSFLSNVLTLMSGTILAHGLTLGATPFLTRLYTPEDFGGLGIFLSISSILGVASSWRYEAAIVLPQDDRDGLNVLALTSLLVMGMAALSFIVIVFGHDAIARLMNTPKLASWLWLIPLSLLLSGLFQAFNYWCTRKKQFRQQATARVGQAAFGVGTQLGAGILASSGAGALGLITGTLAGQLVSTGMLGGQILNQESKRLQESLSRKAIVEQAIRYKKLPSFFNLACLVNEFAYQIPIWFLASFYGAQVVGFYALACRAAYLPAALMGDAVSKVYFEQAVKERNQTGNSIGAIRKVLVLLTVVSILPYLILMIWGPQLFTLIFGQNWEQAGQFAAILAPLFGLSFIARPFSMTIVIHGKEEIGFFWQVGLVFLSGLSLWGANYFFIEAASALKCFGLALAGWYLFYLYLVYRMSHGYRQVST